MTEAAAAAAPEQQPVKLLISGSIEGRLDELYKRCLRAQRKSGQHFAMLFCVGDFFGPTADATAAAAILGRYASGEVKAPLPTYVVSPLPDWAQQQHLVPDPTGCEIGPNLVYLGRRGLFSGQTGLKVAYLSGATRGESNPRQFSSTDLAWLANQARGGDTGDFPGVDLLLTCAWPAGVLNCCDWLPLDEREAMEAAARPFAHPAVAALAVRLRPRYHVCACPAGAAAGGGLDFERRPYRNHRVGSERERHVTRFHSLAGLTSGRRCLYALQLTPLARMRRADLLQLPAATSAAVTDCPYEGGDSLDQLASAGLDGGEGGPSSFFFAQSSSAGRGRGRGHRGRGGGSSDRRQQPQKRDRRSLDDEGGDRDQQDPAAPAQPKKAYDACWFCLGNPDVQRHLVVSVAKATYLALPRGPLVPKHVIALPISHHKCLSDCPAEVQSELARYKRCLAQLYSESECAPVYIERNFKCHHAQLQCIPVPMAALPGLKAAFHDLADKHEPRLSLRELHPGAALADLVPPGAPYFCADLPTGERLFCPIRKEEYRTFPLSFGRDVLASRHVYDCPDRVDWRDCAEPEEAEAAAAEEFKKAFAPFDFSLKTDYD